MLYLYMLLTVFIAIIAVIVSLLFGRLYGKSEKVDKGFAFCYWKLSYRRKFIRTLWLIPSLFLAIGLIQFSFESWLFTGIMGILLGVVWTIQAVYNYKKWKAEE